MDFTLIDESHRRVHPPCDYTVVAMLRNETGADMVVWLEMLCEQLILAPGHQVELLARSDDGVLPLSQTPNADGITIHAAQAADPDWHVRFKGHLIKPAAPTRLADFEDIEGPVSALWPQRAPS